MVDLIWDVELYHFLFLLEIHDMIQKFKAPGNITPG